MIDLNKEISKKDFLKLLSKFFLSFTLFSLIPLKTYAVKTYRSFKMKIKPFKHSDIYKKNDLAG